MTHEQAVEAALDALGGEGGGSADGELRAHLASCAACRAEVEALRALWADMGRLPTPAARPAAEAEARLRRAAAAGRLDAGAARGRSWRRRALSGAAAAALAASFLAGIVVDRRQAPGAGPEAADTAGQSFLLLLHEPRDFHAGATPGETRALVEEYRAWATRLGAEGRLGAAEKLAEDDGRWLRAAGTANAPAGDAVSGFFVIHARDYEEAATIARGCPHLRHGGTVELRLIERT